MVKVSDWLFSVGRREKSNSRSGSGISLNWAGSGNATGLEGCIPFFSALSAPLLVAALLAFAAGMVGGDDRKASCSFTIVERVKHGGELSDEDGGAASNRTEPNCDPKLQSDS